MFPKIDNATEPIDSIDEIGPPIFNLRMCTSSAWLQFSFIQSQAKFDSHTITVVQPSIHNLGGLIHKMLATITDQSHLPKELT